MTPPMVLYLLFFATAVGVVIIAVDPGDPDVMHRPPRDPAVPDHQPAGGHVARLRGGAVRRRRFVPLVAGPDEPSTDTPASSMTMTFVVMGLGTVFNALVNRRDPTSGLTAPIVKALAIALVPVGMVFLATQLPDVAAARCSPPRSPAASGWSARAWRPCCRSRSRWARWSGAAGRATAGPRTPPSLPSGRRHPSVSRTGDRGSPRGGGDPAPVGDFAGHTTSGSPIARGVPMSAAPDEHPTHRPSRAAGELMVLLAMAMFVLVVDTSLMNVSISAVITDLDTTASGVQSAIALEALVSAAFILINSKVGDLIGRKRAYVLGLLAYAVGALAMTLAQSLTAIVIFWAIIGGLGASLLLPAMQSLIHGNFAGAAQKQAYALVGAAAAIAAAIGPLLGGFVTTYLSWRVGFALEVVIIAVVLSQIRLVRDVPYTGSRQIDVVGAVLSVIGMGGVVLGILVWQEGGEFVGAADGGRAPWRWCSLARWLITAQARSGR